MVTVCVVGYVQVVVGFLGMGLIVLGVVVVVLVVLGLDVMIASVVVVVIEVVNNFIVMVGVAIVRDVVRGVIQFSGLVVGSLGAEAIVMGMLAVIKFIRIGCGVVVFVWVRGGGHRILCPGCHRV